MAANPLFNSIKRKQSHTSKRGIITNSCQTPVSVTFNNHMVKCVDSFSVDGRSMDEPFGNNGPPGKRRRTEEGADDQFWEEDIDFTVDQLENIDNIIASQQIPDNNNTPIQGRRSIGKGTPKSFSSGDIRGTVQQISRRNLKSHMRADTIDKDKMTVLRSIPHQSMNTSASCTINSEGYHSISEATSSASYNNLAKSTKRPTPTTDHRNVSSSVPGTMSQDQQYQSVLQKQMSKMKEELDHNLEKVKELEGSQYSKDGQIKMLREALSKKEAEVNLHKQEKLLQLEEDERLKSEKEQSLQKEVEKLQAQLHFKQQEVMEAQSSCKKLQRIMKTGESNLKSPEKRKPSSPAFHGTPRSSQSKSDSDKTSTPKNTFPNRNTFMLHEKSPRVLCRKSSDNTTQTTGLSCSAKSSQNENVRSKFSHRLPIPVSKSKGFIGGPHLMSKLIGQIDDSKGSTQGLVALMQSPPKILDLSAIPLERDHSLVFSPSRRNRSLSGVKTTDTIDHTKSFIAAENYTLAQQSLGALLQTLPNDINISEAVLTNDTESAILLLPIIEDYLNAYIDMLTAIADSKTTSPTQSVHSVGGYTADGSSLESVTSSLQSLMMEGASYANNVESCALNALNILHQLVEYSPAVRMALICDTDCSEIFLKKLKSTKVEKCFQRDEKAEEPKAGPSDRDETIHLFTRSQCISSSLLEPSIHKVVKESLVLRCVLKLANFVQANNQLVNVRITITALHLLSTLVNATDVALMDRFQGLITQETLLTCLSNDIDIPNNLLKEVQLSALDLTTAMSRSSQLMTLMCSPSADCLLSTIYNLFPDLCHGNKTDHRIDVGYKIIELLSSVIAKHRHGFGILLESDCQCSVDVVKTVILIVHEEYKDFQSNGSPLRWQKLKQGLYLLHSLSLRDRLYTRHHKDVEHQYVELVCGIDVLAREDESLQESEIATICGDLWDFDQEFPESIPENDSTKEESGDEAMDVA